MTQTDVVVMVPADVVEETNLEENDPPIRTKVMVWPPKINGAICGSRGDEHGPGVGCGGCDRSGGTRMYTGDR